MKLDPYKHEERYFNWKIKIGNSIPNISESNSNLILHYLNDMEKGINVASSSVKGSRSFGRLNSLKDRLIFFAKKFEEIYNIKDITQIKEEQLISFFSDMKNGNIKREDGKEYQSVETYSKIFKAFWHWHQKVNRKNGNEIPDITTDLDTKQEKPKWVYLTEEQIKRLCENSKYEYKVLFMFLFDIGIRSPTELMNVRVSDLYNNCKELNIREEISKTFGRRIKLMICSELLKEFVKIKCLDKEDYLFQITPSVTNQYIKRLSQKVLGNNVSEAGQKFSELTMYDFRHISCCYWLPRYKSESALKYRFGWKKSDMIHYYTELLGMKDTIKEEDMYVDVTKTELEKEIAKIKRENQKVKEQMTLMAKESKERDRKVEEHLRRLEKLNVTENY